MRAVVGVCAYLGLSLFGFSSSFLAVILDLPFASSPSFIDLTLTKFCLGSAARNPY